MLIDRLPKNFWEPQILLNPDQYKEEQASMIQEVEKLLLGKYSIIANRIYQLPADQGIYPQTRPYSGGFHNAMNDAASGSKQIFSNETSDWPYVQVWKTSGPHPEYVALALYRRPHDEDTRSLYSRPHDENTLLGYFELKPVK